MSVAVATTILRPGPSFDTWLEYTLGKVDRIVIYMDKPDEEETFPCHCKFKSVTLFSDAQDEPGMTPERRLIIRQEANLRHAIAYLLENKYDWLLHIDDDELLYEPLTAQSPLDTWRSVPEIGCVNFFNHEAVPLTEETVKPFEDCTWFRFNDGKAPFMAYGNGKSAVRLGPSVRPAGPHGFAGYTGELLKPGTDEAMILHYPTPCFSSWVTKFKHYGRFPSFWFGDAEKPDLLVFMTRVRWQSRCFAHAEIDKLHYIRRCVSDATCQAFLVTI